MKKLYDFLFTIICIIIALWGIAITGGKEFFLVMIIGLLIDFIRWGKVFSPYED